MLAYLQYLTIIFAVKKWNQMYKESHHYHRHGSLIIVLSFITINGVVEK